MRKNSFFTYVQAVYGLLVCGVRSVGGCVQKCVSFPHLKLNTVFIHNNTLLPYAPLSQSYPHIVPNPLRGYRGVIPTLHRAYLLLLPFIYRNITGSNEDWKMYKNEDNGWKRGVSYES